MFGLNRASLRNDGSAAPPPPRSQAEPPAPPRRPVAPQATRTQPKQSTRGQNQGCLDFSGLGMVLQHCFHAEVTITIRNGIKDLKDSLVS